MRASIISILISAMLTGGAAFAAEPAIYLGPNASDVELSAANELQRYLHVLTKRRFAVQSTEGVDPEADGVVLGTPDSLPALNIPWPFGLEPPKEDGYLLCSLRDDGRLLAVASTVPRGVSNGVYGLLEELGFGFYLSGETCPDFIGELPHLKKSVSPVFAVRGTFPWHDFFSSAATWEFDDYKALIDNMVCMRLNFLGVHAYDTLPFAAFEWEGAVVGGEPLPNTSRPHRGCEPLPTGKFFAGTGQYFPGEHFGAASSFAPNREEAIQQGKDTLRQAFAYAKARGMMVGLGFEVQGDALDPEVQARFEARLRAILNAYPMLDTVWLWEGETESLQPKSLPKARSLWDGHTRRWEEVFGEIDSGSRRAEAVRVALFAQHARQVLKAVRPDVRLVLSGWGGDDWLRFTDFLPGMDAILPEDVVFAALDNAQVTPTISHVYGELAATRTKWPIVCYEFDGDLWMPQPNLFQVAGACRDAKNKGCQGLLGRHWRTRRVDHAATYCARFAWDPELTPERFLERRALDLFGKELGGTMAPYLLRLEELGYRWVGGWGQTERSLFTWGVGEKAKRDELEKIAADLRTELGKMGVLPGIVSGLTGDLLKGTILPASLRADKRAAVNDLLNQIEFVLAYDSAAAEFAPEGTLDALLQEDKTSEAIDLIAKSKLAAAMHLYGRGIMAKEEMGALAAMNTKAWANLRKRLAAGEEQWLPLESLPPDQAGQPHINVLPGRVVVTGLPEEQIAARVSARAIGGRRFREEDLMRIGGTTYAMALPPELSEEPNVSFGVEVKYGFRKRLLWPVGFPVLTRSETRRPIAAPDAPALPEAAPVEPVKASYEVVPEWHAVRFSWETKPAELYTVSIGNTVLGTVADGWFEDLAPASESQVRYTITARNVLSGQEAVQHVSVRTPELPLPKPPGQIEAATRDGRVILGWDSNCPVASQYRVTKLDEKDEIVGEWFVDADYGQYLQATDQAPAGKAFGYRIAGVAPDGRIGKESREIGVIVSSQTADPLVRLSFEDESFLAGLAQLADNALALGGQGWAELPSQSAWNPEDALTICAWIKLEDLEGMPVLVCKGKWQESGYFVQILNKQVRFYVAGVDTLDAGTVQAGQWQMITAVYGFGQMRVYIGGELAGRKRVAGSPTPDRLPLLLGRYGLTEDVYFVRGLLDEVRIYSVALTQPEIAEIMEETKRE